MHNFTSKLFKVYEGEPHNPVPYTWENFQNPKVTPISLDPPLV